MQQAPALFTGGCAMLLEIGLALGLAAQPPATPTPSTTLAVNAQELALARQVAAAMVPVGALGKRMQAHFRAFGTAGMAPIAPARSSEMRDEAFFEKLRKATSDPAYVERMRITLTILNEAGLEAAAAVEPVYREAVAKALVRRLSAAELRDVLAFAGTPSGRTFAGQIMDMEDQPETIAAGKDLIAASMQRMGPALRRIEQATAHLPPLQPGAGAPKPKR
jgi:hypothetical protein